jgi:uncharacterized protein YdeI (YjbR/CyaY-like superfamily)
MAKGKHNPEAQSLIDEYISNAPEFAQPICIKLRRIILKSDQGITEDWKWGPHYQKNGMICGFGAFKHHVSLTFFKGSLLMDPAGILTEGGSNLHNKSVKFKTVKDVNDKIITEYIKEAVKLNESGTKIEKKGIEVPADFQKLLNKNKDADNIFEKLAYTHKKEYVRWITEAKKVETRERRIHKAIEMIKQNRKEP